MNEAVLEAIRAAGGAVPDYFAAETLAVARSPMSFAEAPEGVIKGDGFEASCSLRLGPGAQEAIRTGRGSLIVQQMFPRQPVTDLHIAIENFSGNIVVMAGGSGTIVLGRTGRVRLNLSMGDGGLLAVGDDTSINNARIVAVGSIILVGRDGMLSDEVLLQGADQHGIVDLATRAIVNATPRVMVLGRHVWLGRRSVVMPGARVGEGSIVGACSVVTKPVPPRSIAVGIPARVVREGVSWTRAATSIDPRSAALFDEWDMGEPAHARRASMSE